MPHLYRRCSALAHPMTRVAIAALSFAAAGTSFAPKAMAQQPTAPAAPASTNEDRTLYIGAVNADDVYVRGGSGESYYPFFKVHRGDLVKVTEEKYGFARVAMAGPAFRDAYGFIKDGKGDKARLRIAADGHTAVALGRVDILAPNLDANGQAKDSWKTLVRLEADQSVGVIESTEDTNGVLYKVTLPANASGWISTQFVPKASAEDAELFKQMLEGKITQKPAEKPAPDASARNTIPTGSKTPKASAPPAGAQANNTGTNPPVTPNQPQDKPAQPTVTGTGGDQATVATPPSGDTGSLADQTATTAPATQPEKPHEPTLDDVETAFKALQKEPIETAEVMPLRDLYLALAERHPKDQKIQRYAQTRAKQLEIWQQLQQKKLEVTGAQDRMKTTADEAEAIRAALERSQEYTAVGRVAASTIYDGVSLPKLFRLQDSATGRTIAYLKPDADYMLANRIDIIVGIVGDKVYDESLRLNIITPRRVDALSADKKNSKTVAGVHEREDK